ncbi:Alpha/Beta hydrolase protein [Bipolaris maydis]|nr:Alpha/Beta hydrolase protein [Bipolaris maydis]
MQCISTVSTIQCVHLCLEFGLRTQSNNSNPGYDNGFGIILEHLLGYGDTAKPEDPTAYSSKSMAFDLAEILAAEGITHTIVIGHDWGSFLGQRLYFWAPERVAGLVMLNVAYFPRLDRDFDFDQFNATAERATGLQRWSYWGFYASEAASAICSAHPDSLWYLAGKNLKREWLLRMEKNGFEGPLCWYKAIVGGITPATESELDPDLLVVKVPALFIGPSKDQLCLTSAIRAPWAQGFLPDLQIKQLDCFHRPMLENPEELALSIKH